MQDLESKMGITEDRLSAMGFEKRMKIWYLGKFSVSCYKHGIWKACYGMSPEIDLRYMSDVYKAHKELTGYTI